MKSRGEHFPPFGITISFHFTPSVGREIFVQVFKMTHNALLAQAGRMATEKVYLRQHYVDKHLPLISQRIEFRHSPRLPLPVLTARTEFKPEDIVVGRTAPSVYGDRRYRVIRLRGPRAPSSRASSAAESRSPSPASSRSEGSVHPSSPRRSAAKIPKPSGEPGRPGSGGYSIEDILIGRHDWTEEQVNALTVHFVVF